MEEGSTLSGSHKENEETINNKGGAAKKWKKNQTQKRSWGGLLVLGFSTLVLLETVSCKITVKRLQTSRYTRR